MQTAALYRDVLARADARRPAIAPAAIPVQVVGGG
jgi:hypothetical protein